MKSVCSAGLGFLDCVKQAEKLALASGWRDVILHVVIEDDEAGGIALQVGHIAEGRSDEPGIVEFVHWLGAVRHGSRSIQQDQKLAVGLPAVAFKECLLRPGEDVPVDVSKIVPLGVGTILGKFLREPKVRRSVQSGYEPIDYGLGD